MVFFRGFKNKILSLFLTATVILSLFPCCVIAETTSEKIKNAEKEKKQTEAEKQAVTEKKENLKDEKEKLENYLDELNENLTEISENLEKIEERIGVKKEKINEAQTAIDESKEAEEKQYNMMKLRLKHLYEHGESTILSNFLSAESYGDFLNLPVYIKRTQDFDKKVFSEMVELRKDIEKKEEKLQGELSELEKLREDAEKEQSKVTEVVSDTSGKIAAHDGAISVAEVEEAKYELEIKAQEQNLAELKKQLAIEQAMTKKAAKMAWRDVSEISFEESDKNLLACLIYCEAGNQPYEGQVAVGAVVINRMRSAAFPDTMVGVIYQSRQFSPVGSGRLAARLAQGPTQSCLSAAEAAMSGSTPVGNCLYFRTVIPQIQGQIIGGHVFY